MGHHRRDHAESETSDFTAVFEGIFMPPRQMKAIHRGLRPAAAEQAPRRANLASSARTRSGWFLQWEGVWKSDGYQKGGSF